MSVDRGFTRVLVPSGVLGLGFDEAALERALALEPDLIAIDGGSTDSGPHYLGSGTSKYADAVVRDEWRTLMRARERLGVPLVIGSVGTCGTDAQVDAMLELTRALAAELGHRPRVATLHCEQSAATVRAALGRGALLPLDESVGAPAAATVDACTHIVALAGVEQVGAALAGGADIVIAGRTTDTALIAALPIAEGRHRGAAWHAAKVAECGALCSTNPTSGVVVVDVDDTGFEVRATADGASCTPRTVAAHMLYENADPFVLHEPGGRLDVGAARHEALDEARVRVTGSRWIASETYTVKLEGARLAGFQTTLLALLRDPRYVANARVWAERVERRLTDAVRARLGVDAADWTFETRLIGVDATLGALEHAPGRPHEVGVLAIVTASSAPLADEIARLADPLLLHCPLEDDEPLPTFAFPHSPVRTARGAQYAFCLDHAMVLESPMAAFRLAVHEPPGRVAGRGGARAAAAVPAVRPGGEDRTAPGPTAAESAAGLAPEPDGVLDATSDTAPPSPKPAPTRSPEPPRERTLASSRDGAPSRSPETRGGVLREGTSAPVRDADLAERVDRTRVRDHRVGIRSKNAGPFRLTIDLFCDDEAAWGALAAGLTTATLARAFRTDPARVRRFELPELRVLKFSLPRPCAQGATTDRDMHGAQWALLVGELFLDEG